MAPFGLRRIRSRVFLLLALTLLPVVSLQVYSFRTVRANQIERASADLQSLAHLAAASQARAIGVAREVLPAVAMWPEFTTIDAVDCGRGVARVADLYPDFIAVSVVRTDGTYLCSTLPETEDVVLGDREWVRTPLERGTPVIELLVEGRVSRVPVVVSAAPVRDASGTIRGVLGAGIPVDVLVRQGAAALGPGIRLELFTAQGLVIGAVPAEPDFVPYRVASEHLALVESGASEAATRIREEDGDRLAAFASLGELSDVYVAVSVAEGPVLATATRTFRNNMLALMALALMSMAVATWGSRSFVEVPLSTLVGASRKLKLGSMTARAPVDGPVEVEELAEAFNAMAAQLDSDSRVLAELNQSLADEVRERARAQERVQESERHLRALIEAGHDVIALISPSGRVLFASPATERISGVPVDGLLGTDLSRFMHPDDRAAVALALKASGPDGGPPFLVRLQASDGSWRTFEAVARNLEDDPVIGGTVVNARDVTDREASKIERLRLLERTARHQELLLELTTGEVSDIGDVAEYRRAVTRAATTGLDVQRAGVWSIDVDRSELRCEDLFDRSTGEHSGGPVLDLARCARFVEALSADRAVASADAWADDRMRELVDDHLRPAGIRSTLDAGVLVAGTTVGVLCCEHAGSVREWTPDEVAFAAQLADQLARARIFREREKAREERDAAEMQLRQAQKLEMVGTMAGGIAHDFNNILTPILGHAQLALDETGPDAPLREALEAILRAAGRARDVVRRILTFSRAGEQQERAPLYLQDVVREALELVRASLPATIELVSELDPGCPPVMGEPTQIHQVVLNLCTNAAHAIEPGAGRITVTVTMAVDPRGESSPDRERVRLMVRDTGVGISPNVLERMFDPFFTTKSAGEGTGLGLSVVHGIVANHDASISVESEPGGGSVFSVFFTPAELSTPGPVPAEPLRVAGSERLLFVDDEKPIRDLMVKGLGRLGYRVTACEDAREALQAFQAAPDDFDIVVTDMSMPGMTGAELLVALRRVRPGVPVLLVTGFADGAGRRAGGEEDFDATLLKPIGPKQLAERVRAVLAARWVPDT